jgi:putative ABC transport system permease protein
MKEKCMFFNYLKVAFRNLLRNRVYSLINLGGLAHGLACCLLIVSFIGYEYSFDRFHTNGDRLYRILFDYAGYGGGVSDETPAGIYGTLSAEYPEIQSVIRLRYASPVLNINGRQIVANGFLWADSGFFNAFSFKLLKGDPSAVLRDPNSVVLTQSAARQVFGDDDPIGKVLPIAHQNFTVTGLAQDVPGNSHFSFRFVAPFEGQVGVFLGQEDLTNFTNWNYPAYVLLAPGTDVKALESRLPAWIEKYVGKDDSKRMRMILQPIRDIHLSGLVTDDFALTTDKRYLVMLGTIALVILFIAGANFMNLSTARSMRRAREVGIRKILGTVRSRLMLQFVGESLLMSLLALPLAVVFAELMLPIFDQYVNRHLNLLQPIPLLGAFALSVLVGVLGGIYPAVYLSWFKPIDVLKGRFHASRQGILARRGLIIAQYAITTVLMIATLIVIRQFRYMRSADPGFQRDHIVYFTLGKSVFDSYDAFRQKLLNNVNIQGVARAASLPGYLHTTQSYIIGEGTGNADSTSLNSLVVDEDFVPTLGIQVFEGRNFSRDHPTDETEAYLINEAAAKSLGLSDPVGKPLHVWSRPATGRIIGVVKNFNYRSLHQSIGPLVMRIDHSWCWTAVVRLGPNDIPGSLKYIERVYREMSPDYPFSYQFIDESLARLYAHEERLGRVLSYLTLAAILIASLGLFGLASFSSEQRIKELGVRKVLGASPWQLTALLIRQFTVWVMLAVVAALPIAYYVAGRWLQNFAYRVGIGWQIFGLTIVAVILIAVSTVIVQAIRASRMNPADALRYE